MTDLSAYTRHTLTDAEWAPLTDLLRSGAPLTQGPAGPAFEAALCEATGAPHTVVVNSGTAALHLAYALLFPPGHRVRMPAISFVATGNAALYAGMTPVFCDVDRETGLVTEDCDVGVELGGQPTGHTHPVVDACHSFRYVPTARITVLSFHPAKHLACGEGGALLTADPVLAERARLLRSHGRQGTAMVALGFNYRMPDLNAALGWAQVAGVAGRIAQRQEIGLWYDETFAALNAPWLYVVPHGPQSHRHLYQIRVPAPKRDALHQRLHAAGIGTAVHYPVIPDQPFYAARGYRPDIGYPNARAWAAEALTLPLFPGMTRADVGRVVDEVGKGL